jgi:agarase
MVVGSHWYRYADPPAAGGPEEESGNYGLVSVTDEPYEPLVSAVMRANQGLYTRLQTAGRRLSAAARRPPADGR